MIAMSSRLYLTFARCHLRGQVRRSVDPEARHLPDLAPSSDAVIPAQAGARSETLTRLGFTPARE